MQLCYALLLAGLVGTETAGIGRKSGRIGMSEDTGAASGTGETDSEVVHGERLEVPNSTGTEPPGTPAPVGATDCHMHIYDPRFPLVPGRPGTVGTIADYRLFQRRLGLSRTLLVAPSGYGVDNSCLVEALQAFGDGARGVASVDEQVTDEELQRLAGHGACGIRLNFNRIATTTPELLTLLAGRVAELGWHVQINMQAGGIVENESVLSALPCPFVIDHFGHLPQPEGPRHPAMAAMRRLLDKGNTWVKLSGAYLHSEVGAPTYSDYAGQAVELVAAAPERLVWGSDWPHVTAVGDKPDGARLFDLLAEWVPDAAQRRRVLVDNPAQLYGFG